MNVLFIENKLRMDKLGPLYLSAVMKERGHNVDLIQAHIDNIDDYLHSNKIDYICYSAMSDESQWYIKLNKELIKKFKFKSIVGGPHFTFFPEDGTENGFDHVVVGPGELVINDIIEGKIKDQLIKGILPDLNSLPDPDRSIIYKYPEFGQAGMKRFIASRDCPNACTYCFNHKYHRLFNDQKSKFFQRKNPEKLIKEILDVKNNYPLTMVYFNDDDFISNIDWLKEFTNLYIKKINLPYCGSLRANHITPKIINLLSESNCTFMNIALESANPDTQKLLRRGNITNDQVENAVFHLQKNGIKIRVQNIIGLPVEDPLKDALDTLEFNQKLNPTDSWVSILQPYYGTDIWKTCLDKGLLSTNNKFTTFYTNTVLDIPDKKKIDTLHKLWYFAVKHNIPRELIEILIEQELNDNVKEKIQKYRWSQTAKDIYKL